MLMFVILNDVTQLLSMKEDVFWQHLLFQAEKIAEDQKKEEIELSDK